MNITEISDADIKILWQVHVRGIRQLDQRVIQDVIRDNWWSAKRGQPYAPALQHKPLYQLSNQL